MVLFYTFHCFSCYGSSCEDNKCTEHRSAELNKFNLSFKNVIDDVICFDGRNISNIKVSNHCSECMV